MHPSQVYSFISPFTAGNRTWVGHGNAVLTEDNIYLTEKKGHSGGLWNPNPFKSSVMAFEVELRFNVYGETGKMGDGFAFWYTKEKSQHQGPESIFGGADKFTGLGVFFDTNDKSGASRPGVPAVKIMLGHGSVAYGDIWPTNSAHNHGGMYCESAYRADTRSQTLDSARMQESRAVIRLESGVLTVMVAPLGSQEYSPCISLKDVYVPDGYYFGISASTSEHPDNHIIRELTISTAEQEYISDQDVSAEEMDGIDNILRDTNIVKILKERGEAHAKRLNAVSARIESSLKALEAEYEKLMAQANDKEATLLARVGNLELASKRRLELVQDSITKSSGGWIMPLFLVGLLAVVLFVLGSRKFAKVSKKF